MWGYGYSGMILMSLGAVLGLVLLGVLVWALIRWLEHKEGGSSSQRVPPGPEATALQILQQRYARGEIDTTTFEMMREHLATPVGASKQANP